MVDDVHPSNLSHYAQIRHLCRRPNTRGNLDPCPYDCAEYSLAELAEKYDTIRLQKGAEGEIRTVEFHRYDQIDWTEDGGFAGHTGGAAALVLPWEREGR